ncbi:GntR family transcriptional regulator [Roseimicrobium gellanilyticum]|uniref:GntR family transcriptional regulator n=1 Tax=Roseimicrobium gellanilyticum TaxID=748857 RepID=A0A366H2F6_9BACT|nr:PLP-dependent aminotransferase family protein [Roseimicrobium gellanilyticum]RBP35224.1 GntR family transcriptional regulator [Roseimicrobium gellanilyticum]
MAEDSDTALYEQVARSVEQMIHSGTLRAGDKVPSVRRASEQHGVSVTTVVQAYLLLEDRGLIEARPKSGFYVRAQMHHPVPAPEISRPPSAVTAVTVGGLQSRLFQATGMPGVISFGNAAPAPELLPTEKLNRALASVARRAGKRGVSYNMPPGTSSLRREIARRMFDAGSQLSPNDLITTSGGTEALILCLRAVTSPGDIVAVESPTYFGVLHVIEELKLRAIEIPMHPDTGMDLDALEQVLQRQKVAACVSVPNFSNPLGSLMPDENKERLVRMLGERNVPLIEDDIFGELYYGAHRPRVAQAYDEHQNVLLYGSFSKTLAPGYRVGWVAPGKYLQKVQSLKLISTLATATLPELAIAEFLATGGYDHYLRTARRTYEGLVERVSNTIAAHFPQPVKMTQPKGGFLLWVELPPTVDALKLDDLALEEKISIAPGPMFSAKQGFRNFIRISCANAWSPKIEKALIRLGALVKRLM